MNRLRTLVVAAAVVQAAGAGLSASPAAAADAVAACDPALAPGLTWSAPSFLAWGRTARLGANVADSVDGPGYVDDSLALRVDAGSARAASDPIDSDLEFAVKAPSRGTAVNASATWTLEDATATVRCAQAAAVSVPLGPGETLRFATRTQKNGVAWVPLAAGDCHEIALEAISVTVQQGSVTRRLTAADQCDPAGHRRAATRDWELVLADGTFELRALSAHSSLKTRMRYALRVGSRRVASGSLSLVRSYKPERVIVVANPAFQDVCVHGIYRMQWIGDTIGCKVPGALTVRLKPA
jgi:hypothetical protein